MIQKTSSINNTTAPKVKQPFCSNATWKRCSQAMGWTRRDGNTIYIWPTLPFRRWLSSTWKLLTVPERQNHSDRKDFWLNFLFNVFIFCFFVIHQVSYYQLLLLLQDSVYFSLILLFIMSLKRLKLRNNSLLSLCHPSIHPLVILCNSSLGTQVALINIYNVPFEVQIES